MGKKGRPPKTESEKLRGYRYNLNLDRDLKNYLEYAAWKNHTSITQYLNDLIRSDAKKHNEVILNKIENIIDDFDITSAIINICNDKKIKIDSTDLKLIVDFIISKKGIGE